MRTETTVRAVVGWAVILLCLMLFSELAYGALIKHECNTGMVLIADTEEHTVTACRSGACIKLELDSVEEGPAGSWRDIFYTRQAQTGWLVLHARAFPFGLVMVQTATVDHLGDDFSYLIPPILHECRPSKGTGS